MNNNDKLNELNELIKKSLKNLKKNNNFEIKKENEIIANFLSEYFSCYYIIGYDINNNSTILLKFSNEKDLNALTALLLNFLGNI